MKNVFFLIINFLIITCSLNLYSQISSKQSKGFIHRTTDENWNLLKTSTQAEIMKNYDVAIEFYELFISKVADQELKHSSYGHMGYCYSNKGKFKEGIYYLSRYLDFFYQSKTNSLTLEKINTENQDVGKFLITRGFCKAKLEDFFGAEKDLTKGINFMEMLVNSAKYNQEWNYETLGFGYLIRGLSKMGMKKVSFCDDLRKSLELGYIQAIEAIKIYCN